MQENCRRLRCECDELAVPDSMLKPSGHSKHKLRSSKQPKEQEHLLGGAECGT